MHPCFLLPPHPSPFRPPPASTVQRPRPPSPPPATLFSHNRTPPLSGRGSSVPCAAARPHHAGGLMTRISFNREGETENSNRDASDQLQQG